MMSLPFYRATKIGMMISFDLFGLVSEFDHLLKKKYFQISALFLLKFYLARGNQCEFTARVASCYVVQVRKMKPRSKDFNVFDICRFEQREFMLQCEFEFSFDWFVEFSFDWFVEFLKIIKLFFKLLIYFCLNYFFNFFRMTCAQQKNLWWPKIFAGTK